MINNINIIRWLFSKCYLGKHIIITVVFVLFLDIAYILSKNISSVGDAGFLILQGYGQGYLSIIDLLFFIIFNFIPLYFTSLALEKQNLTKCMYSVVRCRSKQTYINCFLLSFSMFLIVYFIIHGLAIVLYSIIFNCTFNFGEYSISLSQSLEIENNHFEKIILFSLILRFLELLCIQEVLSIIQSKTNKLSIAFICAICAYFSLIFIQFKYYPIGISSVIRWGIFGQSININFFIGLIILVIILVASHLYMCKKGIFELLER